MEEGDKGRKEGRMTEGKEGKEGKGRKKGAKEGRLEGRMTEGQEGKGRKKGAKEGMRDILYCTRPYCAYISYCADISSWSSFLLH